MTMRLGRDTTAPPSADEADQVHPAPPAGSDRARSAVRASSRLVAGVTVLIGVSLLLLRTDAAGQVWGAVLAALGLVVTVALEWVRVARRRALQR